MSFNGIGNYAEKLSRMSDKLAAMFDKTEDSNDREKIVWSLKDISKSMRECEKNTYMNDMYSKEENTYMNDMYSKEDDEVLMPPPDELDDVKEIPKPAKATWTGKIVVCLNNEGFEQMFEKGIDYLCWDDSGIKKNGIKCIGVNDMMNQPVIVPKVNFKCEYHHLQGN